MSRVGPPLLALVLAGCSGGGAGPDAGPADLGPTNALVAVRPHGGLVALIAGVEILRHGIVLDGDGRPRATRGREGPQEHDVEQGAPRGG